MKNSVKLFFIIVLLQIFTTGCNKTDDDELNSAIVAADDSVAASVPVISEVTGVATSDNISSYTFNSTESGSITYEGSCSSSTTSVTAGKNTIIFNALSDGTYSNCTIIVTDSVGNVSNYLTISSFTVAIESPIAEVTAVSTPSNDSTPDYTFSSTEEGTVTYGGSCSSSTTSVISGNNTITLEPLSNGTYSDCTITVTYNSGKSTLLSISSFVIDTTSGNGTVSGSVLSKDNNSTITSVSVSFEKSGTTTVSTTTDNSGGFSQTLALGTYTITYSKTGYLDEIQSITLSTDNQTVVASTLKMLSDSCNSVLFLELSRMQ